MLKRFAARPMRRQGHAPGRQGAARHSQLWRGRQGVLQSTPEAAIDPDLKDDADKFFFCHCFRYWKSRQPVASGVVAARRLADRTTSCDLAECALHGFREPSLHKGPENEFSVTR